MVELMRVNPVHERISTVTRLRFVGQNRTPCSHFGRDAVLG